MADENWGNLPVDLLTGIAHKLSLMEDCVASIRNFSAACKSWNSSILNLKSEVKPLVLRLSEEEQPWLPPKHPWLLLAEPTATMPLNWDESNNDGHDHEDDEEDENNDGDDNEEDDWDNNSNEGGHDDNEDEPDEYVGIDYTYKHENNSIANSRGLFSLSTRKTHVFLLPEAAGRVIAGTNKGWLVTLGRDFQMNLLHPLLRRQIPLPSMHTFSNYYLEYHDHHNEVLRLTKVVLSSRISTLANLQVVDVSPPPTIMTIYGERYRLGFAKLGDKSWTDVDGPWGNFDDIVYHKERFCGVDCRGDIYMCDINNDRGEAIGTRITSFPGTDDYDNRKYLVESLCGSYLYLLVRFYTWREGIPEYLTTKFVVWKFKINYDDSNIPSCKWVKVRTLRNNALFVGRMSSVCVRATGCIKRNCIYFTDDYSEGYHQVGGGYDMGIYNLQTRTVKPHFRGLSIHPLSPPLWYM